MKFLASFAFIFVSLPAFAEFRVPALTGPVVDNAEILSDRAEEVIGNLIRELKDSGGSQIQVVTVQALDGTSIEEASIKIADQWKLGNAATDKGVLVTIAPNDRQMRFEVGQGLEGDLTDVTSQRIIREVMTPYFKEKNYDEGVLAGVASIIQKTDPQFQPKAASPYTGRHKRERRGASLGTMIFFFILLLFLSGMGRGRRRRSGLGGFLLGYGMGGGFGGGGGWGGSGGGGGGWSGGGGGFSGGGSSGSW